MNERMVIMLKAAIEKIVELAHPSVLEVSGRTFSTGEFEEVRPLKFYPKYLPLYGLDSVVKMVREEAIPTYEDKKVYVQVSGHNTVSVFTEYDEERRRADLYLAKADVPGFREGFRDREEMVIQLRSLFLQTPDTAYLLDLISHMTDNEKVTTHDNGVTQSVEAKKGIALKEMVEIRPRVKLTPFRTFLEVEQPESEFLLRIREDGAVGLFEADGGVWKLVAKRSIVQYLEERLDDFIQSGRVVVMM